MIFLKTVLNLFILHIFEHKNIAMKINFNNNNFNNPNI